MSGDRWVLLGLARGRSAWFAEVARWATSAAIAAEFVKCVSAEEVRSRLASGRPHSALLVDLSVAGVDADLVAAATATGAAVIAVGAAPRWGPDDGSGVAAVLPEAFGRTELLGVLAAHARPIGTAERLPPLVAEVPGDAWRGRLVAVCGPGGTGASVTAIALAQGAAADIRYGSSVVLADLALHADQAVLHDATDLGPGITELADAHRRGRPGPDDVRALTFDVPRRGYRLLLGLRRPSAWSALRPLAADAALDGLRRTFQVTVADVTGDVEGEADGGSIDVEERNHMARRAATSADVVVVVGDPGMVGVHALGRLLEDLVAAGVSPTRLLPVFSRAPRQPRARAALSSALAVTAGTAGAVAGPVFVPERHIDDDLRDGAPLPGAVVGPLEGALRHMLDALADAAPPATGPTAVVPGSLGSWAERG